MGLKRGQPVGPSSPLDWIPAISICAHAGWPKGACPIWPACGIVAGPSFCRMRRPIWRKPVGRISPPGRRPRIPDTGPNCGCSQKATAWRRSAVTHTKNFRHSTRWATTIGSPRSISPRPGCAMTSTASSCWPMALIRLTRSRRPFPTVGWPRWLSAMARIRLSTVTRLGYGANRPWPSWQRV